MSKHERITDIYTVSGLPIYCVDVNGREYLIQATGYAADALRIAGPHDPGAFVAKALVEERRAWRACETDW